MNPYWEQDGDKIYHGHVLEVLKRMADESVHMVITSPPYWGLRDYGIPPQIWDDPGDCGHQWNDIKQGRNGRSWDPTLGDSPVGRDESGIKSSFCQLCGAWRGSLGLEPTPELYIKHMVQIFAEVKRVLRDDGTLWLNIGDSYCGTHTTYNGDQNKWQHGGYPGRQEVNRQIGGNGLKTKDLVGIPWMLAFALRADGWYLRSDIIWSKPNPMPGSQKDRPTTAHEYVFLLSKSARYFYDNEAIKEPCSNNTHNRISKSQIKKIQQARLDGKNTSFGMGGTKKSIKPNGMVKQNDSFENAVCLPVDNRSKRSVWTIATEPTPEAHFATFPKKLVEPCILAGTSAKGCCPECGKPWERIVEKVDTGKTQKMPDGMATYPGDHGSIHKYGREKGKSGNPVMESKTIGWKPGCECGHEPIPCTVLDPFWGSGKTGLVAYKHGRKFKGIELSQTYLDEIAIPKIEAETIQQKLFR